MGSNPAVRLPKIKLPGNALAKPGRRQNRLRISECPLARSHRRAPQHKIPIKCTEQDTLRPERRAWPTRAEAENGPNASATIRATVSACLSPTSPMPANATMSMPALLDCEHIAKDTDSAIGQRAWPSRSFVQTAPIFKSPQASGLFRPSPRGSRALWLPTPLGWHPRSRFCRTARPAPMRQGPNTFAAPRPRPPPKA